MLDTMPGQPILIGHFQGYELSKQKHILALQSDEDLLTEALRPLAECGVGHLMTCAKTLFKMMTDLNCVAS